VVWTFTIKEGVEFSDGTPFDAEAVRFNWERQADPAIGDAEGDEILAEQPHPLGCPVGFQRGRTARRNPIFAQHRAHRRPRTDARE
jgi:ABC-type transport system substrate-binding protein